MSDTKSDTGHVESGSNAITAKTMESVLNTIRAGRDAMTVDKVFGDPYQVDGVTVIPVARLRGGAGGGGGGGSGPESDTEFEGESEIAVESTASREGSGMGAGFGMMAAPAGVYQIRDQEVVWKPAVDVNRLIKGFQVLAAIVAICLTLIRLRES